MEFDSKTPAPGDTPALEQDPNVQLAPLAEQLVGEGKPFKDVEALAKGKTDADSFIEQLKALGFTKTASGSKECITAITDNPVLAATGVARVSQVQ